MQTQTIPMRRKFTKQQSFAPPDSPLHSSDRGIPSISEFNSALNNSTTGGSFATPDFPPPSVSEHNKALINSAIVCVTDSGATGESLPLDPVTKNGSPGKVPALDHFTHNGATGESLPLDHVTKKGSPGKFPALDHFTDNGATAKSPSLNHVTKNGATEEPRPLRQSKNKWWTCCTI